MPYVYSEVDALEKTGKVGSHQCVSLLQHYAHLPPTTEWREGQGVFSPQTVIAKGTAIATFSGGRYQSHRTGNHAAFFLSSDATGIWVMDQWANDTSKPLVSRRFLRRKGRARNGDFLDPSNNADAYAVIE